MEKKQANAKALLPILVFLFLYLLPHRPIASITRSAHYQDCLPSSSILKLHLCAKRLLLRLRILSSHKQSTAPPCFAKDTQSLTNQVLLLIDNLILHYQQAVHRPSFSPFGLPRTLRTHFHTHPSNFSSSASTSFLSTHKPSSAPPHLVKIIHLSRDEFHLPLIKLHDRYS